MVLMLLIAGARTDIKNNFGDTCIMDAHDE